MCIFLQSDLGLRFPLTESFDTEGYNDLIREGGSGPFLIAQLTYEPAHEKRELIT